MGELVSFYSGRKIAEPDVAADWSTKLFLIAYSLTYESSYANV